MAPTSHAPPNSFCLLQQRESRTIIYGIETMPRRLMLVICSYPLDYMLTTFFVLSLSISHIYVLHLQ